MRDPMRSNVGFAADMFCVFALCQAARTLQRLPSSNRARPEIPVLWAVSHWRMPCTHCGHSDDLRICSDSAKILLRSYWTIVPSTREKWKKCDKSRNLSRFSAYSQFSFINSVDRSWSMWPWFGTADTAGTQRERGEEVQVPQPVMTCQHLRCLSIDEFCPLNRIFRERPEVADFSDWDYVLCRRHPTDLRSQDADWEAAAIGLFETSACTSSEQCFEPATKSSQMRANHLSSAQNRCSLIIIVYYSIYWGLW